MPVGTLTQLSDETFNSLVNQDVRGELDPDSSATLREPENIERWHDTLLHLKRSVEVQLTTKRSEQALTHAECLRAGSTGKREWLLSEGASEKWRQGAIRFKNGVEDKIAEAKRLRSLTHKNTYLDFLVHERIRSYEEVTRLRGAITSHRDAVLAGVDDDSTDDQLWACIGEDR